MDEGVFRQLDPHAAATILFPYCTAPRTQSPQASNHSGGGRPYATSPVTGSWSHVPGDREALHPVDLRGLRAQANLFSRYGQAQRGEAVDQREERDPVELDLEEPAGVCGGRRLPALAGFSPYGGSRLSGFRSTIPAVSAQLTTEHRARH